MSDHARSRSLTDESGDPITSTNIEALGSKYSAIAKGYLNDPYISYYRLKPISTSPLMHLGAYLRTSMIDSFIYSFIKENESGREKDGGCALQILSIGSGYDTRPFNLCSSRLKIRYFEVDYETVSAKKQSIFGSIVPANHHSVEWLCVAGDLNHFETHVLPKLQDRGFQAHLPTLLLAELVLVYLDPGVGDAILRWALSYFCGGALTFVSLDHILLTADPEADPFGRMMLQQLSGRSLRLPALAAYPTLADQKLRLMRLGFDRVCCLTMKAAYEDLVSSQEKRRLECLERLDEWEEWNLLSSHYCFSIAHNK